MRFDPADLAPRDRYKLVIGLVVPRPIAWVSTVSPDGRRNLAPFSFFNAFQVEPFVVLGVGVGTRKGAPKDTLVNAEATREFVVNLPDESTLEAMNATSADLPYGADEFEHAGLTPVASDVVRPPRVGEAKAAFECRLFESLPMTRSRRREEGAHGTLLLGEVVAIHVAEGILDERLRADVAALAPVARLGGPLYWRRGEVVALERPSPPGVGPSREG